ncbi:ABC transporter transmembrane domain-containing protein [Buchnera aphidicola]|uniref:Multidrug resistance-like ATP-binding protein MdlB n=1 Tax=Buchnera aphidicola (Sarucallis kahawaluokalani) TaxID=1241878 RepID=A0A4D6Y8U8_9GAMM|nr:ABC transporter transmembrane domain-containing protein [Buchnera aphidicola]QCI26097.1 ATP-binding cassette domain-containing protein [Buchnera aphidicola (Sarucallis kahawaluokalani)]
MADFLQGWPTLKRLLKYSLNYKKTISIAFLILCIASYLEVLAPILVSYFINNILTKHKFNKTIIIIILFMYLTTQILSTILNYLQVILFNNIAIQVIQQLRIEIFSTILKQKLKFFKNQPIGKIVSIVTNDTEVIKLLYDTVLTTIFKNTVLICIILSTIFIVQWKMAIIVATMFPCIIFIIILYQYYSIPIIRKMRIYLANINHTFYEIINGIATIQQFSQEHRFQTYIQKISQLHYQTKIQILKIDSALLRPLISLLFAMVLCGLMILFIFSPINTITIGAIYAFISYLNRLNEPLITIATQQSILQQAIVAGERIFKIIDSKKKQKYGNDTKPIQTGTINIKNVSFQYKKKGPKILHNINLNIVSNSFIAIIGKTGSGKSTLINLLMGHYTPTTGNIYIDNRLLSALNYPVLRNGIYMVQQEPTIFIGTIKENITLGKKISTKKVWDVLKKVQLYYFIQSLPKKINFKLNEKGDNLSIGQKQLLSIARILILKPKILILDEATANIDTTTEKIIQKTLNQINKTTTIIVIAHRLSTIIQSDNIVILKNGKIVETGNHKKLIKNKGIYYNMCHIK